MNINKNKIFGNWQLIKWESKLLDSEYQDVYQDKRENIISNIKVWETEEWYSNLYSGLFKREFHSEEELLNFQFNFKNETDHRGHYEVELLNSMSGDYLGKFWWKDISEDDWPKNANSELSLLDYTTYGNIDKVNDQNLKFTDITEGIRINGKVNFEYAIHELTFLKIDEA